MDSSTGDLEIRESSMTWKIENFSKLPKKLGQKIKSPTFDMGDLGKNIGTKWHLELYPFGDKIESDGYVSVYLTFIPSDKVQENKAAYSWKFSILNSAGNDVHIHREETEIGKFKAGSLSWGYRKFIKRSELFIKKSTLLKEDTLVISVTLQEKLDRNKEEDDVSSSLANEYESLYLSKEFSDVTIVTQDKEIKAHKCILSSRSKVFAAMLKHNMEEGNTSVIKIMDIDYDVMKEFLLYIYSGKLPNIDDFAKSLLSVSDKYDVIELKKICEKSLWEDITIDNACETLIAADLYNCKELKSDVMTYIVTNIKDVLNTETFEDLSKSNNTLLKEILCEVVKQRID